MTVLKKVFNSRSYVRGARTTFREFKNSMPVRESPRACASNVTKKTVACWQHVRGWPAHTSHQQRTRCARHWRCLRLPNRCNGAPHPCTTWPTPPLPSGSALAFDGDEAFEQKPPRKPCAACHRQLASRLSNPHRSWRPAVPGAALVEQAID